MSKQQDAKDYMALVMYKKIYPVLKKEIAKAKEAYQQELLNQVKWMKTYQFNDGDPYVRLVDVLAILKNEERK